MRRRIGELCAGYGALGMAVREVLGGEIAWVADSDPDVSVILACRFPSAPNHGDITTTDWGAVEPVDVLTAGFPCQDVSCAGGRAGLREGNRTGVWAHVARAIDEMRPSLVVLENVRGLLSAGADSDVEPCPWCLGEAGNEHPLRALGAVLGDLAGLGFDAEWVVVSAAGAGAPHRRERVFILAWPAADSERATGARLADAPQWRADRRAPADGYRSEAWPGIAPEDADGTASGEWRQSAPGQAAGGRSRADAGRPGGAPAPADADSTGKGRFELPSRRYEQRRRLAGSGQVSADPERDRLEGERVNAGPGAGRSATATGGHGPARGGSTPADADDGGRGLDGERRRQGREGQQRGLRPAEHQPGNIAWGAYAPAIARWEAVLGRPAPRPTEPGRTGERLSPRFVEWMQGLPEGWVTGVPGLSRNAQLKALGNGVVPQQAAMALRTLLARADILPTAAAGQAAG